MTRVLIEFEVTEDGRYITSDGVAQVVPIEADDQIIDSLIGYIPGEHKWKNALSTARPTAKVVEVPERQPVPRNSDSTGFGAGWNACLDALKGKP